MSEHYNLKIRIDEWESLRKILDIPHEHVEGRNSCPICDKSLVQDAIDQITTLQAQVDRYREALKKYINHGTAAREALKDKR